MGDSNNHGRFGTGFPIFQPDPQNELEHQRLREKRLAEAQAYHALAYREMPADLRDRAKEWGVSALMEAIWLNAWDCGYRQAVRDRAALKAKLSQEEA